MISILIPVFNWDVRRLVATLREQCESAGLAYEILVMEDGSAPGFQTINQETAESTTVDYQVFEQNQGRARIRNLLAQKARYEYLLFLDCDSGIPDQDFIRRYVAALREGVILYGGRRYEGKPPLDKDLFLHWRYGYIREQLGVIERQKEPHHRFMTNNFLIPKSIFEGIGFDERLRQYGHEDTLFGMELMARDIPILHLDNPVIHLGLEPAGSFLEKNRQAMENLAFLWRQYPGLETKLLENVRILRKWGLEPWVYQSLRILSPFLRRNLLSAHPHLRALDLFKLYMFLKYDRASAVK